MSIEVKSDVRGRGERHDRSAGRSGRGLRKRNRFRLTPMVLGLEDRRLLATFTVTSTADNGSAGTLRWAIEQANAATTPSTIDFSLGHAPAAIVLSEGVLELSNTAASIAIDGPSGGVSVNADGASRVLQVEKDVTATISGLTITGGSVSLTAGGLYNQGTVTLTNCAISGNSYGLGNSGTVTLDSCTVSGNSSVGLANGGTATLDSCTVDDNSDTGVYNSRGTVALTDCTISGNSGTYWGGGFESTRGAKATLRDCQISGNFAKDFGGGLASYESETTLVDCTISGNSAGGGGGVFISGGLGSEQGYATLTGCTISNNSATGYGGGLGDNGPTVTLTNTIVAGNLGSGRAGNDIGSGNGASGVTGTYNLIGTGGSGGLTTAGHNLLGVADPGLAPLANNGGPTETMALLPASPAIRAGTVVNGIATDQRGDSLDSPPDIGAYQVQRPSPTITWSVPAGITYGTLLSSAQLDAAASVPGTFTYSPPAGTVLKAGRDTLSVTFRPTDTADYQTATATVAIDVAQATPTIRWPGPAPIVSGTPLSSAQLDAGASVPGTFTYSPPAGSVLGAGTQTLTVNFVPTDSTDYRSISAAVPLTVLPAHAPAPTATTARALAPQPTLRGKKVKSVDLSVQFASTTQGAAAPSGVAIFEIITRAKRRKARPKVKILGTTALVDGRASLSFKVNQVLKKSITVIYGGDATHLPETVMLPALTKRSI